MYQIVKRVGDAVALIAIMIICEISLMCMVWCIPQSYLDSNIREGTNQMRDEEEVEWHRLFTYSDASRIDNPTDFGMLFYTFCDETEMNVLEKSMIPDYARYWHGYLIFLRPLSVFLTYMDIRYLNMLLHLVLFSGMLIALAGRTREIYAIFLAVAMGAVYFPLLPFNMNCSSVFFIMYIFCIWLLKKYDPSCSYQTLILAFLGVGMITNFFDLLTAPLVTLGIPLILICLLDEPMPLRKSIMKSIHLSLSWGMGYSINWIAKWAIASLVLRVNVWNDAVSQAIYRSGVEEGGVDSFFALKTRFASMFKNFLYLMPECVKSSIIKVLIIAIILVYAYFWAKYHRKWRELCSLLIFPCVSIIPYIWFGVFSNHSLGHTFFTYRIQIISIVAMLIWFYQMIDWTRINKKVFYGNSTRHSRRRPKQDL